MYGPWGCPECGWSSDPHYDQRSGQKFEGRFQLDQWGGAIPVLYTNPEFFPEFLNDAIVIQLDSEPISELDAVKLIDQGQAKIVSSTDLPGGKALISLERIS